MAKGFSKDKDDLIQVKELKNKKLGSERMISWSPWPPANFQTKYPAFPLIMTILLVISIQFYLSLAN
tara:strand:- start:846 stop:1046 length:201 start_codon:yes stop_codon:yes gene_type:complete